MSSTRDSSLGLVDETSKVQGTVHRGRPLALGLARDSTPSAATKLAAMNAENNENRFRYWLQEFQHYTKAEDEEKPSHDSKEDCTDPTASSPLDMEQQVVLKRSQLIATTDVAVRNVKFG